MLATGSCCETAHGTVTRTTAALPSARRSARTGPGRASRLTMDTVIGTSTRISWSAAWILISQNAKATGDHGTQAGVSAAAMSPDGSTTSTATETGTMASWRTRCASNVACANRRRTGLILRKRRLAEHAAAVCANGAADVSTGGKCAKRESSAEEPSVRIWRPSEGRSGRVGDFYLSKRKETPWSLCEGLLEFDQCRNICAELFPFMYSIFCIYRTDVVSL